MKFKPGDKIIYHGGYKDQEYTILSDPPPIFVNLFGDSIYHVAYNEVVFSLPEHKLELASTYKLERLLNENN